MRYVFVLILSLTTGGAVYFLTLRSAREERLADLGFGPHTPVEHLPRAAVSVGAARAETDVESRITTETLGSDPPRPAGPGYTYLRVATAGPSSRERLQGFVGLVILVAVSASVLALAVYEVGHIIDQTIQRFVK